MAKQTFTTGQVLTAAQMTSLQQTAMLGGAASAKTASYTLVAADAGTAISMSNASATTITVNTALFAAGDTVQITNIGAGVCTITAGTATVNTSASLALAQYESGTLNFTSTSAAIFIKGAGAAGATGDNFALINAGGTALTGAATITVNVSGKNILYVRIDSASSANSASSFSIRLNADSGANYIYSSLYAFDASALVIRTENSTGGTSCVFGVMGNSQISTVSGHALISGTNATGVKPIQLNSVSLLDNTSNRSYSLTGSYLGSSAITSVSIISSSGNFDAGTIYVYGA